MANEQDPIYGVILKHYTDNPTSIDAKFGGDPKKATDSYFATQAAYTALAQENARLKAAASAPAPTPSADPLTLGEPAKVSSEQVWTQITNALENSGGTVTPDIQALATTGNVPLAALNVVASSVRDRRAAQATEAATLVGGQDRLQALLKWQETNLTPEERTAVNASLRSPAWRTTLLGLASRAAQANPLKNEPGSLPTALAAGGGSAVTAFTSMAEQARAISDPKYRTDPDYRALVEKRILATAKAAQ